MVELVNIVFMTQNGINYPKPDLQGIFFANTDSTVDYPPEAETS
jgi:hypothetical protein